QGRVPELRREGPVRRRLRKLRHRLFADEAEESVFDALGSEAGAEVLGAPLLQALRSEVQGVPERMDQQVRPASAAGGEQSERVARGQRRKNARRLGHL